MTTSKLREKLPEILIEGVFVVFAILLALAADEWREDKQRSEVAERALDAIEAEIRENREQMAESQGANEALVERLQVAVEAESMDGLDLQYEYATLSGAAWQTAQVTQAVHYADFELVQDIARLYDMQELFVESQRGVVEQMSGVAAGDPAGFLRAMLGRIGISTNVGVGYMAMLDTTMVRMESR